MSGKERYLQINNFSGINTTKWLCSDEGEIFSLRMSKEIYNRLEILRPVPLREDVFKYAQSNSYPSESLQSFTDVELLKLKMAQLYVLPQIRKRIIQQEKESSGKACEEVQFVSNFSTYATPRVSRNTLTLGKIPNPYGIFEVPPVQSSGMGSLAECLRTWKNTGKPISEMSTQSLLTQENRVKSSNAPRFTAWAPLSGKSLSSFRQQGLGKVSENLVSLWELMKNDPPAYQKVERVFVSTNQDSEGLLLKIHLKKYWQSASSVTYKSVFYSVKNFLDFQKNRNEPAQERGVGSVLIFSNAAERFF